MQYLRLPDNSYAEFPDSVPYEEALKIARRSYPKLYGIEPTVGGQVKELVRGVPAGFVGGIGQIARGIGALLPEELEQPYAKRVEQAVKALTPEAAEGYEDTVGRKLGEALGSFGTFLIPGGVAGVGAKVAGAGLRGVQAAQLGTAGALGSAAGAGEARTRAEAESATPEQRAAATGFGAVIGVSEIAPLNRLFGAVGKELATGIINRARRALATGGEEALQEFASNTAQNLVAQKLYKPTQELMEGSGEAAAYGGAVGALTQTIMDAAFGRRAMSTSELERRRQREERAALEAKEKQREAFEALPGQVTTEQAEGAVEREKEIKAALAQLSKRGKGGSEEAQALREERRRLQATKQLPGYGGTQTDLFGETGGAFTPVQRTEEQLAFGENYARAQRDIAELQAKLQSAKAAGNTAAAAQLEALIASRTAALEQFKVQGVSGQQNAQIVTWDTLSTATDPDLPVTLYRGESASNIQGGQWWTTNPAKAAKYGTVQKVTLPLSQVAQSAARGHGGNDEFVFPAGIPTGVAAGNTSAEAQQLNEEYRKAVAAYESAQRAMEAPASESAYQNAYNAAKSLEGMVKQLETAAKERGIELARPQTAEDIGKTVQALNKSIERAISNQKPIDALVAKRDAAIAQYQAAQQELPLVKEGRERAEQQADLFAQAAESTGQQAPAALAAPVGAQFNQQYLQQLEDARLAQQEQEQQAQRQRNAQAQQERLQQAGVEAAQERITELTQRPLLAALAGRSGTMPKDSAGLRYTLSRAQEDLDSGELTPTVSGLLGLKIKNVSLSNPEQAETALPVLEARIRELEQRRKTEFPSKELVYTADVLPKSTGKISKKKAAQEAAQRAIAATRRGQLTPDGIRLAGVEAQLNELRKLQGIAQRYAPTAAERAVMGAIPFRQEPLSEEAITAQVREANKAAEAREEALFDFGNVIDSLRKGEFTGSTPEAMRAQAAQYAEAVKQTVIQEANAQSIRNGNGPITTATQQSLSQLVDNKLANLIKKAKPKKGQPTTMRGAMQEAQGRAQEELEKARREGASVDEIKRLLELRGVENELAEVERQIQEAYARGAGNDVLIPLLRRERDLRPQQDVIRRGMTIASRKSGELAGLRKWADSLVTKAAGKVQAPQRMRRAPVVVAAKEAERAAGETAPQQQEAPPKKKSAKQLKKEARQASDARAKQAREAAEKERAEAEAQKKADARLAAQRELETRVKEDVEKLQAEIKRLEQEAKAAVDENLRQQKAWRNIVDPETFGGFEAADGATPAWLNEIDPDYFGGLAARNAFIKKVEQNQAILSNFDLAEINKRYTALLDKRNAALIKEMRLLRDVQDYIKSLEKEASESQLKAAQARVKALVAAQEKTQKENVERGESLVKKLKDAMAPFVKGVTTYTSELVNVKDPQIVQQRRKIYAKIAELAQKLGITKETEYTNELSGGKRGTQATAQQRAWENERQKLIAEYRRLGLQQTARIATTPAKETASVDPLGEEKAFKQKLLVSEVKAARTKQQYLSLVEEYDLLDEEVQGQLRESNQLKKQIQELAKQLGIPVARATDREAKAKSSVVAAQEAKQKELAAAAQQATETAKKAKQAAEDAAKKAAPEAAEKVAKIAKAAADKAKLAEEALAKIPAARKERFNLLNKYFKQVDAMSENINKLESLDAGIRSLVALAEKEGFALPAESTLEETKKAISVHSEDTAIAVGTAKYEGRQRPPQLRTGLKQTAKQSSPVSEPDFRGLNTEDSGIDTAAADGVIKRVQEALPKGIKFTYYNTLADAPLDLQIAAARQGASTIKGAVMPDGTVVVIGEAHKSVADLQETIAHELIGHYGADMVLGPEGVKALSDKLWSKGLDHVAQVATGLGLFPDVDAARMALGRSEDGKLTIVREMIAQAAEGKRIAPTFVEKVKTFIRDMVAAVRAMFRNRGLSDLAKKDTKEIQALLRDASRQLQNTRAGVYVSPDGQTVFRGDDDNTAAFLSRESSEMVDRIVYRDKPLLDRIKGNLLGLGGITQFVDRTAPFLRAMQRGVEEGKISDLEYSQARYYLAAHDKRLNYARHVAENGALELRKFTDAGETYRMIEKSKTASDANLVNMFKVLGEAGLPADKAGRFFTVWLGIQRAKNEGVGLEKLNYGNDENGQPLLTKEKARQFEVEIASEPKVKAAFEEARRIYNEYNKGLIDFAVQAGAIKPDVAAKLKAKKDFIPYYRKDGNNVNLWIGGEKAPITVGNLKEQPYLQELMGGDEAIVDVFTSSMQNTYMLTDMALRNLSTKNIGFTLRKLGMLDKRGLKVGQGPAGPRTLRFRENGNDMHVVVKTEGTIFEDIDPELLVMGLEGVKTTFPAALQLLGIPAKVLRRMIILNPLYPTRQIMRESMAAYGTSGADFVPILGPLKGVAQALSGKSEIVKEMEARGLAGGQLLAAEGLEGMSTVLRGITANKKSVTGWLAWLEAKSIQADTGVRVAAYSSFKRQGLNEIDTWLATNDILDYNKRGISPGIYVANALIPFFNTQIQGLNVFARAMTGNQPFEQRLNIREKFIKRGLALAAFTMIYAAAMEDDEAYKNATPEQRIGNWFIYVPGISEPVKWPIPFEYGLLVKAIPEAFMNVAFGKDEFKPIAKALWSAGFATLPNITPQIVKPFVEFGTGTDLFTGAEVETAKMKRLDPTERYKETTTEVAKTLSKIATEALSPLEVRSISPVKVDQFIRGVGSELAVAIASLADPLLRTGPEIPSAEAKASKTFLIGKALQPTDAGRIINYVYDEMEKAEQAHNTLNKLADEGRDAEFERYAERYATRISLANDARAFRATMANIAKAEEAVKRDRDMTPKEKADMLQEFRNEKISVANSYRELIRQTSE